MCLFYNLIKHRVYVICSNYPLRLQTLDYVTSLGKLHHIWFKVSSSQANLFSLSFRFHSKYGVRLFNPGSPSSSTLPPSSNCGAGSTLGGGAGSGLPMTTTLMNGTKRSPVGGLDVYVHYAPADAAFAHQTLNDGLRSQYSLYLHHRDTDNPSAALGSASRVILVASNDYMLNEVSQDEMRTIMERMRQAGREKSVIVVVLNGAEKKHLKKCFNAECNFVRWSDPAFWKKLKFHLPDGPTGERTLRHSSTLTAATAQRGRLTQQQHGADYEDEMWTYMKGSESHSGQDSSLSTKSTTDNSNHTLPPHSMSMTVASGAPNSRRRPQQQHMSLKPKSISPPSGSARRGSQPQRRSATTARRHLVSNPLEDHYDSEYMSVVGAHESLAQRHVNPPLPEPIYHTLEPPSPPPEMEAEEERGRKSGKKKKKGKEDTVYINDELEVVYPKRGDQRRQPVNGTASTRLRNGGAIPLVYPSPSGSQQRHLLQMLQNGDDGDDEYADQEDEELLQNEFEFDDSQNSFDDMFGASSSRSQLGSCGVGGGGGGYVPSPAPGSMPRRPFDAGLGAHHQFQQQQPPLGNPRGHLGGTGANRAAAGKQPSYYI